MASSDSSTIPAPKSSKNFRHKHQSLLYSPGIGKSSQAITKDPFILGTIGCSN